MYTFVMMDELGGYHAMANGNRETYRHQYQSPHLPW